MPNTFKNSVVNAVGTAAINAYVCPAATQTTAIGMTIANLNTNAITANVMLNAAGSNVYILKSATIPPGGALVPIGGDQKLVLEAGDYLHVNTSIASSADVVVSVLEIS
jgi:hypothetical protein